MTVVFGSCWLADRTPKCPGRVKMRRFPGSWATAAPEGQADLTSPKAGVQGIDSAGFQTETLPRHSSADHTVVRPSFVLADAYRDPRAARRPTSCAGRPTLVFETTGRKRRAWRAGVWPVSSSPSTARRHSCEPHPSRPTSGASPPAGGSPSRLRGPKVPSATWLDRHVHREARLKCSTAQAVLEAALAGAGLCVLPCFIGDAEAKLTRASGIIAELGHD